MINIKDIKTIDVLHTSFDSDGELVDNFAIVDTLLECIEELEGEVLDLKAVDEMRCIGLENKRIRINKQNAYIEQLEAATHRGPCPDCPYLDEIPPAPAKIIEELQQRIEELEDD